MSDTVEYLRTLARATSASDRRAWSEATALWELVVESNPVNGNYWDRLAEAHFELGDYGNALRGYGKVAEIGVWAWRDSIFPGVPEYRIACCHAELGNVDNAIAALGNALTNRFRFLDMVRTDEHLATLRSDPRFVELLGDESVDGVSRDEGWRIDLRLLAREAARRVPLPLPDSARKSFDAAVEGLRGNVPEFSDAKIVAEIWRLLGHLGDGHAFVELTERHEALNRQLPLRFYLFEEGVFVIAADPAYEELLGAEVLAFDGASTEVVLESVEALICRDNAHRSKEVAPSWLRRTPFLHALGVTGSSDKVMLTVRSDGASRSVEVLAPSGLPGRREAFPAPVGWRFLPETLGTELPLYLRNCGSPYWFDHLPEHRLVYFQFNQVADDSGEKLNEFSRRMFEFIEANDVDRLVVDLRWNGGGNTFLVPPLLHRMIACTKVNRPGGLFVIVGRRTFSAAQNTTTWIDFHTEAIIVGEPTGASPNFVGETMPFELPYSGLRVNVSDLYWQTSNAMDRRSWIAPELYAPPTFEAYKANRDPAMEAILTCRERLPGR